MNVLQGKRILLGVTGSIAAYKTPHLVRLLKKSGAEVRVAVTRAGADFVSPLTLSTVSEEPVAVEFVEGPTGSLWNNHVEWGMWPDLVLVAPASANTLAQAAQGLCGSFLSGVVLSAKCPVMWAPAMDLDMYQYPSVQQNLARLASFGHRVIPAESGPLASGLDGQGRMPEPEMLVQHVAAFFAESGSALGKKVLITSGPTHEAWDSVRYLGNRSSGKMGKALAEAWAQSGAQVTVLLGPGAVEPQFPGIHLVRITSAIELFEAVQVHFPSIDVGMFSAAVADYRPAAPESGKRKKNGEPANLTLVENPDSLAWAGQNKGNRQYVVGFALEEQGGVHHAREKRIRKNCDALFFNEIGLENSGMGAENNSGLWLDSSGEIQVSPRSKTDLAEWMVDRILSVDRAS